MIANEDGFSWSDWWQENIQKQHMRDSLQTRQTPLFLPWWEATWLEPEEARCLAVIMAYARLRYPEGDLEIWVPTAVRSNDYRLQGAIGPESKVDVESVAAALQETFSDYQKNHYLPSCPDDWSAERISAEIERVEWATFCEENPDI